MRIVLLPLAALLAATPAVAQTMSTGFAPWRTAAVTSTAVQCTPGGPVVATNNAAWFAAPTGSQWVSCNGLDGGGTTTPDNVGPTYSYVLNLNEIRPAGGTFNFQFAADNNITFTFGSGITGVTGSTSCTTGLCFQGLNGPVSGSFGTMNAIITAQVTNIPVVGLNPTGFLVVGTVTGPTSVVPEPGTYALLGTGLVALAGMRLRRRAVH